MQTSPSRIRALTVFALSAGLLCSALAAGHVQVRFTEPEHFTDIGLASVDREANLKVLASHMKTWEPRLRDNERLEIEVLDVDLAGERRPWRHANEVRVLNGRVDGPRMTLRWALKDGERVLKSGQDKLSDLAYLTSSARLRSGDALAYDLRMLEDWASAQVLSPAGKP